MAAHWKSEFICTLVNAIATGVSKLCCDVRAIASGFPCVGKCCSCALYQPSNDLEVIRNHVVEVPTQTYRTQSHTCTQRHLVTKFYKDDRVILT